MAALSDLSDIINRLTGGNNGTPEHLFFQKSPRINGNPISPSGTRRLISLWLFDGIPGGVTALPGAVSAPTNATNGSLKQTNPGGGRQKWLLGMNCMSNYQGNLILYDRLLHMSGLSGSVITDQTVGGTLTRYTGADSVGNQIWIEIFFNLGSTSTTITANYVNQTGI